MFLKLEGVGWVYNVVGDRPIKVVHCTQKRQKDQKIIIILIITFVFWDAWKLIILINIYHNKYPSSCKVLGQK